MHPAAGVLVFMGASDRPSLSPSTNALTSAWRLSEERRRVEKRRGRARHRAHPRRESAQRCAIGLREPRGQAQLPDLVERADFCGKDFRPQSGGRFIVGRQRQSQRKAACGSHQPRPSPPCEDLNAPAGRSLAVGGFSPHDTRWQRCCRVFFVLRRTVSYQPPKCNIRLISQKSIFWSRSGWRGRFRWSGAPCFSCQASKTFAARSGNGGLSKASPEASWDSRRASDDSRAGSSGAIFIRRRAQRIARAPSP